MIWENLTYLIISVMKLINGDDENITITDGNEEYEVEKKYITKYFDYAYARTHIRFRDKHLNLSLLY
jgi:hypothetical protein